MRKSSSLRKVAWDPGIPAFFQSRDFGNEAVPNPGMAAKGIFATLLYMT
jgi:hypothetical protein